LPLRRGGRQDAKGTATDQEGGWGEVLEVLAKQDSGQGQLYHPGGLEMITTAIGRPGREHDCQTTKTRDSGINECHVIDNKKAPKKVVHREDGEEKLKQSERSPKTKGSTPRETNALKEIRSTPLSPTKAEYSKYRERLSSWKGSERET